VDKNVWKEFELAVQQKRWDERYPNAKKGKPIFPRSFYAVKVKLVGQKPQYLNLHDESYYSYYGGMEYDTSYDLVSKKQNAWYFTDYSDARENLEYYTYSTCEEENFEWAKIITIWKRSRAPYEWDGLNWFQSKFFMIKGRINSYTQTLWETKALYGKFGAIMMFPYWPHNIIRRMFFDWKCKQQRFFRKGDDFLF
jgi:hypothetical protein